MRGALEQARPAAALAVWAVRLGFAPVRPPEEDFDRDRTDRRVIAWIGAAILLAGALLILVRALR